jgi:salicylate hydroxylase
MTDRVHEVGDDGTILVAGGGIGGLASAIALGRIGRKVQVLERAAVFEEAGAGIQLGPNASRILARWGVWQALERDLVLPQTLHIHDGLSGTRLTSLPLKELESRYGAPYGVVHRADLQRALLRSARALKGVSITTGFEAADARQQADGVMLESRDGGKLQGAGLIAADGVHSTLRQALKITAHPRFSGKTAWRALLPAKARPEGFKARDMGLWLGPRAHLVHYPVAGGKQLNLVAVIDENWRDESWNAPGSREDLLRHYGGWATPARGLVAEPKAWRKWALAEMAPLAHWGAGRITLIGDAAHPMLPFLAQGGAMAIEDAAELAQALETSGDIEHAFARLYEARQARTARLQNRAKRLGQIYHLGGMARFARNLVLKARSPQALLGDLDWLYRARIGEV